MKVDSKISYLGEINSILPGQIAEQLAVEVYVKKHDIHNSSTQYTRTSCFIWFGFLNITGSAASYQTVLLSDCQSSGNESSYLAILLAI